MLGGYDWYPPLAGVPRDDAVEAYARRVLRPPLGGDGQAAAARSGWSTHDAPTAFITERFGRPGAETAVDAALRNDTTIMLVDDPVKRVDNMTMAWGLEARVPFLDHELVELAGRIPPELKLADGGKGVLKRASPRRRARRGDRPDQGLLPGAGDPPARGPLPGAGAGRADRPGRPSGAGCSGRMPVRAACWPTRTTTRTTLGSNALWQLALLEMWLQHHGVR